MSLDITGSNSPPSPKEEAILRALLKQKNEELAMIDDIILKARNSVASSQESIDKLTASRNTALEMLSGYQEQEEDCKRSLESFDDRFSVTSSEVLAKPPESWDPVQALLASHIPQRKAKMEVDIRDLESICSKIQAVLRSLDEDLLCQEYLKEVNTKTLEIYSQTRKKILSVKQRISYAFSAIKRVPEEIWSDILVRRIAQDSLGFPDATRTPLFLPALSFSQVCRVWRSLLARSPHMWASLHWRVAAGATPNPEFLEFWKSKRGHVQPSVMEIQSIVGHASSAEILGPYMKSGSKSIVHHIQLLSEGASDGSSIDVPPKSRALALFLYGCGPGWARRAQAMLLGRFPEINLLFFVDLLPPTNFIPSNSVYALGILLSCPHKSYNLASLLQPSLQLLELHHSRKAGLPTLTESILLPNLVWLVLTPFEAEIAAKLEIRRPFTLRISSPLGGRTCPDGWLDSIHGLCATLVHLMVDGTFLTKQGEENTAFDVVQILRHLRPRSPYLQSVKFANGLLDGSVLVDCLEKQQNDQEGPTANLAKLTIDKCIGISQMDCERMIPLVGKLNVYDTFHHE